MKDNQAFLVIKTLGKRNYQSEELCKEARTHTKQILETCQTKCISELCPVLRNKLSFTKNQNNHKTGIFWVKSHENIHIHIHDSWEMDQLMLSYNSHMLS